MLTSFNPGAGQPLAQVSIFVPKALDTLSAESSDGTFFTGAKYKSYRGYRFTG